MLGYENRQKKIYYGAAFYPELWTEDVITEDIHYMREVGINVVRMGEFAWSKMEPNEDQIRIDFFVDIINRLNDNQISTIFCTPTPTPPIWMSHGYPERLHVNDQGIRMNHGARQHCCTNHPYFRDRSRIIVEAVAKAVGKLPGVIGWQTDNEFKCHVTECMCPTCNEQWHQWLEERYGSIEALNEAWGTEIWSERYQYFNQVPQPLPTPFIHNASLSTTYRIFSREKIAEFQEEQIDIIRMYSDAPITHNTNSFFSLDNELIFKNLDFASFDNYPDCDHYQNMLLNYDLWRNAKENKAFWVMETSTSYSGYLSFVAKPHRNGYLVAEAVAAYALGAEGFSHWLWRQQKTGCEQNHSSVLSAWGKPTVGYDNVLAVSKARKELEDILLESQPNRAQLAIAYSDRAKLYFQTEPFEKLQYTDLINSWYEIVLNTGIHRDLIFEGNNLTGYKILMTPFVPYLSGDYLNRAKTFVENGGIWIVGPLTGGRTSEHTVHNHASLGNLEALAGIETVYTYPMTNSESKGTAFGITAEMGLWSSVFKPLGAKVMGTIDSGLTPGMAFLTEHTVGKGKMVMLGSMPQGAEGTAMIQSMVRHYADEAAISLRSDVSSGTIVAPRISGSEMLWIIVNMDGKGGRVTLPARGVDAVGGQAVPCGILEIGKYEYRAIHFTVCL